MYKLVRDKLPKMIIDSKDICNYAKIQNNEFFIVALKQKLIEEVNEFLYSEDLISLEGLVDIKTIIDTLAETIMSADKFKEVVEQKEKLKGKYNERYLIFYNDPQPDSENQDSKK